MDKYIGVKLIEAEPAIRKGGRVYLLNEPMPKTMDAVEQGYSVVYPDGYVSWSPKDTFERAYMKIIPNPNLRTDGPSISEEMVDAFIKNTTITTIGNKTTIVRCTLANGFELVEASSCVDPANYDEELGAKVCLGKIKGQIWHLLGFLLQCGIKGVK